MRSRKLGLGIFCFVLALTCVRLASPQQNSSNLPFPDFAAAFQDKILGKGSAGGAASLEELLARGYIVAPLGLFDLWYPRHLLDGQKEVDRFKAMSCEILDAQTRWVEWAADPSAHAEVQEDSGILKKWIRSWKKKSMAPGKAAITSRPDLLILTNAKDAVKEASKRFSDFMVSGQYLNRRQEKANPVTLILAPTRENFLGLGSFMGSLNASNRRALWTDSLALWTSFKRDGVHVLALEHPVHSPGQGDVTQGMDMSIREKTGLEQHVVQHAMDLLLDRYYGDHLPGALASGLAMNMVIEMYKENNVRAGGGNAGRHSAAYSRFVPGGASSGGRLQGRNADCAWRDAKGKDHFLKVLRDARKKSALLAKKKKGKSGNRSSCFALASTVSGADSYLLRFPFLEISGSASPLPAEYVEDFLEFHRAYRCCFVYWLKHKAQEDRKDASPGERLRRLLQQAGAAQERHRKKSFEEAEQEIYGTPLTSESSEADSLEAMFLEWLLDH